MSKHDMDAWTKALQRDISIGGAINIKRAEDYALGWNAASAFKDKRIAELETFIEQQSKRMVKLIKGGGADD